MDAATEAEQDELEQDIQLVKSAPNYLADLSQSLPTFLRRNGKPRRTVRTTETERLLSLLEPFQELPQLLDPYLPTFVGDLAIALLEYLCAPPTKQPPNHLLLPLSQAICKLLYTFCKIRGEKVIVQSFSTETRHLELLLSAIEKSTTWGWEERYITLLWLSQLLLAPFDLASISSQRAEDVELQIPGLNIPADVPTLPLRVISLAIRYLTSSGKERDAAKILLVRVAMRPDMQEVGVLQSLVQWAVSRLLPSATIESSQYFYIGILSFLAGMLVSSAGTLDMITYIPEIFAVTRNQNDQSTPILDNIKKSAVSRKIIIKIHRGIALLEIASDEMQNVQTIIGDLLEFLGDESTPVRLAASKALSIITSKLNPRMQAEVVDAIHDTFSNTYTMTGPDDTVADLSGVKASHWHGLILTFSHLLYRKAITPLALPQIVNALRLALAFEKRSVTSATSTGVNVRDAANFGIWALARKYSTVELIDIDLPPLGLRSSTLQNIATDLVVAGTLDPAGNVRRGSSAALQELIGRHPNRVAEGIEIVQIIDYHTIAHRLAALQMAFPVTLLSKDYLDGLENALYGWRGLKDPDEEMRRKAAVTLGKIIGITDQGHHEDVLKHISGRVETLGVRDGVERHERHGLLLLMANILELRKSSDAQPPSIKVLEFVDKNWSNFRDKALIAEACCRISLANFGRNIPDQALWVALQRSLLQKFVPLEDPGEISDAAVYLFNMDVDLRDELVREYVLEAKAGGAYLSTLIKAFPSIPYCRTIIINTIKEVWKVDWNSRVNILRCLGKSSLIRTNLNDVKGLLEEGLDDQTTSAQGDIGSKVRIEALNAITASRTSSYFMDRIMKTAAEKLDRVRRAGATCLGLYRLDPCSEDYFLRLLNAQLHPTWNPAWSLTFLTGYVTSVNGASDISLASRYALVKYVEAGNIVELPRTPAGLEASAFLIDMGLAERFPSDNIKCCTKEKLVNKLLHKYPGERRAAADELWEVDGVRGVDWTKGTKEDLERVRRGLKSMSGS